MLDPYLPPKAVLHLEKSPGRMYRYYRAANWLYGLFTVAELSILVFKGSIEIEPFTVIAMAILCAPIAGYLLAMVKGTFDYSVWRIVHLLTIIELLELTIRDFAKTNQTPQLFLILLGVNFLSAIANHYFRQQRISVNKSIGTGY